MVDQIDDLVVVGALARHIDEPGPYHEADCDPEIGCPTQTQESNLQPAASSTGKLFDGA